MGPPCDPVNGWAITVYEGKQILHCGYSRGTTEEFLSYGIEKSFELANAWWTKRYGGSGPNPNAGPFNNDCYHGNGMVTETCLDQPPPDCHAFPNREIARTPMPTSTRTPTPAPALGGCRAIPTVVANDWCTATCATGFCPVDLCKCDQTLV